MGNELDETQDKIVDGGREVNVIDKQLPVKVGLEALLYQIGVWLIPVLIGVTIGYLASLNVDQKYKIVAIMVCGILGFIPGISFYFKKIKIAAYFLQLQQKLQHDASQIDNYLEQRVTILKNAAKILEKGIELDKETFVKIAELRSGNSQNDEDRNKLASDIDTVTKSINVAFEKYPELKAHNEIEDVMQQNSYLQREITAARELYNDSVLTWNKEIYVWPVNKIVAAKNGYTTRIPFATSQEVKKEAKEILF